MSTLLPQNNSESKPKTLAEIAKANIATAKKASPTGDPNKPTQRATPGKRLNDRWMYELEKFLGQQVEVTAWDGQIIEGTCVSVSISGALPIVDTATQTVIVRNWAQIRRTRKRKAAE